MLSGAIAVALVRAGQILADDPVPQDDDVVAGPWGAIIFVALIAAVVFLAFSFLKQLRRAQAAKDAGVYGDEPASEDDGGDPDDRRPA